MARGIAGSLRSSPAAIGQSRPPNVYSTRAGSAVGVVGQIQETARAIMKSYLKNMVFRFAQNLFHYLFWIIFFVFFTAQ
jgi:hypothetical protein